MKKVGLVSNWDERCGNAQYGRNLCAELERDFTVYPLTACPKASEYDCVVFNWCIDTVHITKGELDALSCPTVLIVQNSHGAYWEVEYEHVALAADVVVAHEPIKAVTKAGVPLPDVRYIPHGIPECASALGGCFERTVGTAGFAFPYKRMDRVVSAAAQIGHDAFIIAPEHKLYEPSLMFAAWRQTLGDKLKLSTAWRPEHEVIQLLSLCTANMYCSDEATGQSGSARLILAAKRPTIIRRSPKVRTLEPFDDEIYFTSTDQETWDTLKDVTDRVAAGAPVKLPNRVIKEQGWSATGKMYRDLLNSL